MANYREACTKLGLVTLNSMQSSTSGKFDIAVQGEGLVSKFNPSFQILQAKLVGRHRGKSLFQAERTLKA